MENSLLYKAAETWNRLSHFCYHFTYGFKKRLYTINLSFSQSEFPHMAGFQYLKDLALPRFTPAKLVEKILEGKITQEQIEKGIQYKEMVEPRLFSVAYLEKIFDNEFILYSFMAKFSPFTTQIKADYLISSNVNRASYVFLIRISRDELSCKCVCSSAFLKSNRNFDTNQRPYSLLKKTKVCLLDGSEEVLFLKSGFEV